MKKSMKTASLCVALIMFAVAFTSCSKVPAGNVGVKVYLLGKDKGVDHEVLGVGRYHIGVNEELYLFPTFQQNYVWTRSRDEGSKNDESLTFQTAEGLSCNADVGISYHLDPEKISVIFQKYRKGIEEITDIYMRNHVRDAFNSIAAQYMVEKVYGVGKRDLLSKVEKDVKTELAPQGIVVDKIYLIGSIRLPDTVVARLNAKIEATQKAEQVENELREAKAKAAKQIAIAKGEAEANRLRKASITQSMIDYERMLNEREAIAKWDGKLPSTIPPNTTIPFIGIKGSGTK